MGKERQDLNRKSSASSRESHGSPWACAELQGKKGLDQGLGGSQKTFSVVLQLRVC